MEEEFFIERCVDGSYDDAMSAMRKQKDKTAAALGQKDEVQAAIDYGIDVSMLEENIKLSHAERIRRHQIALNTAERLRKAKLL